jgi:microcystin-dependent protein
VGFFQWSTTANSNATADPQIGFSAQMAPSSVAPSNRAVMSVLAAWRNDSSGAMRDTGIANAYVLSSSSNYNQMTGSQTALQTLGNNSISFTPANTNTGASTLSIDGLGPFPLRTAPNTELLPGSLVAGSPFGCVYNATDNAFYLQSYYGNLGIPLGCSLDFWGTTAPFSNYALMFGQQISITTFASLYALFGPNRFGADTSSLFFLPDCRGRVIAGVDNMGGTAASRLTSASGMGTGQLGQTGGVETETLVTANLPPYTPHGMNAASVVNFSFAPSVVPNGSGFAGEASGSGESFYSSGQYEVLTASAAAQGFTGTAQGGTSTPVPIVMPAICANQLLRIL